MTLFKYESLALVIFYLLVILKNKAGYISSASLIISAFI